MFRNVLLFCLTLLCLVCPALAQQPAAAPLPNAPSTATLTGTVMDTAQGAIPNAHIALEDRAAKTILQTTTSDATGNFTFSAPAGTYLVRIKAQGFSAWKVEDIVLTPGQPFALPPIELGVEGITTEVNAISVEDKAEQEITAEEHQRILGILPNFYVSYLPHAQPLTRKQKFKLAITVSTDPVTFFTTGVTAAIEQAQGDFSGYGPGFPGYVQRYAATYGTRLSSTMFGAAIFPSLFHQDPRYYYRGHGRIITRALYAISTTVICKGDNGHFQPNYSNVLGNLSAGLIAGTYYPRSDQHDIQVTVSNTLLGVATGAFGTLFQEFLLRHVTHGVPPNTPSPTP